MNKKLRKPSEIILKSGKTLQEVLELHKMWLDNEEGGERANLSFEDLSCVDLSYTDLSEAIFYKADLYHANLNHANFYEADLKDANLYGADLYHAIFYKADLYHANLNHVILTNAKFYLTNLYKAEGDFVSVSNIGSRNDTTHYFYKDNRVICGCFSGTMEEFEEKVRKSYGEDKKEYKQYMATIRILKELAELKME